MPNFTIFCQIRNHRQAELGISPIPGNVFQGTFFEEKNLASLKKRTADKNPLLLFISDIMDLYRGDYNAFT